MSRSIVPFFRNTSGIPPRSATVTAVGDTGTVAAYTAADLAWVWNAVRTWAGPYLDNGYQASVVAAEWAVRVTRDRRPTPEQVAASIALAADALKSHNRAAELGVVAAEVADVLSLNWCGLVSELLEASERLAAG